MCLGCTFPVAEEVRRSQSSRSRTFRAVRHRLLGKFLHFDLWGYLACTHWGLPLTSRRIIGDSILDVGTEKA